MVVSVDVKSLYRTALRGFIVSQKASFLTFPFYTNSLILREEVSFNVSKVFVFNLQRF